MLRENNIAGFKVYSPCQLFSGGANEQRQDTAGVLAVKIELSFTMRLKGYSNESEISNIQYARAHTLIYMHTYAHTYIYRLYVVLTHICKAFYNLQSTYMCII